jgi:hypothetical protein
MDNILPGYLCYRIRGFPACPMMLVVACNEDENTKLVIVVATDGSFILCWLSAGLVQYSSSPICYEFR